MFLSVEMLALVGVQCSVGAKLELKTFSSDILAIFQCIHVNTTPRPSCLFLHAATFGDGVRRATAAKMARKELERFTLWITPSHSDKSMCVGEFRVDMHALQRHSLATISTQSLQGAICVLQCRCTNTPFHACPVHVEHRRRQLCNFLSNHALVHSRVQQICPCENIVARLSQGAYAPFPYP
jgi:hypothetical protein